VIVCEMRALSRRPYRGTPLNKSAYKKTVQHELGLFILRKTSDTVITC